MRTNPKLTARHLLFLNRKTLRFNHIQIDRRGKTTPKVQGAVHINNRDGQHELGHIIQIKNKQALVERTHLISDPMHPAYRKLPTGKTENMREWYPIGELGRVKLNREKQRKRERQNGKEAELAFLERNSIPYTGFFERAPKDSELMKGDIVSYGFNKSKPEFSRIGYVTTVRPGSVILEEKYKLDWQARKYMRSTNPEQIINRNELTKLVIPREKLPEQYRERYGKKRK